MFSVPGKHIGSEMECFPGEGTYVADGEVYAAVAGEEKVDAERKAVVKWRKSAPKLLEPGMIVYGRVEEIFEPIALVRVEGVEEKGVRPVANQYYCVLHVSRVKRGFVKTLKSELRIGDVIKAVVTEVRNEEALLSTADAGLGVVKAFCSLCRTPLDVKDRWLECSACGNKETRKLARPYRTIEG